MNPLSSSSSLQSPAPVMVPLIDRLFIFIMAGGSGERFWPASRKKTPKHLLRLLGEKTLLEQTLHRFTGLVPSDHIFILTNEAQRDATIATIPFHPQKNIIAEPAKRDTAPAATLATALALRHHPEAIVGLFPADAMIHDTEIFRAQLTEAAAMAAQSSALITFSIPPNQPSSNFGYLDLGEKLSTQEPQKTEFHNVRQFVEKPSPPKAKEFFTSGHHGWNAGMFLWQASSFLAECQRQQPALASFLEKLSKTDAPEKFLEKEFSKLPKISVDYAIMEHATQVIAAIASFDWDDVGHWTALPKHLGTNDEGNTLHGTAHEIVTHDATNNIVVSKGKTIALCGVHDLIVVQTADAVLICHRNAADKIKQLPLPEQLR